MQLSRLLAMALKAQRAQVPKAAVSTSIAERHPVVRLPQRSDALASSQADLLDKP
jgi:hypothetical protein